MGKDSALFEDDFDFDLEAFDDLDLGSEPETSGLESFEGALESASDAGPFGIDLNPPAKVLTPMESDVGGAPAVVLANAVPEVGDKPIPAIAVLAFVERN